MNAPVVQSAVQIAPTQPKVSAPVAPKAPKKLLYVLNSTYFSGTLRHQTGDVLYFLEGTQPKSATLAEEGETATPLPEMDE